MGDYTIYFSDPAKNSSPIVIPDQTQDNQSTSLTLLGRNYPGYGQAVATDLVHLLENFSSSVPPNNPIEGQLWFDTSDPNNKKLRINDGGISGATWAPVNGVFQQPDQPVNVKVGDIWVDTANQQLKFYNGTSFTLVGPSYSSATKTGSYPVPLVDINGQTHNVIINYVQDNAMEIISADSFIPNPQIYGFTSIGIGTNISSINAIVQGTAKVAQNLQISIPTVQSLSGDNFLRNDINQSINGSLSINSNDGLLIGKTSGLSLQILTNQYNSIFKNLYDDGLGTGQFSFETYDSNNSFKVRLLIDGAAQTVTVNNPSTTLLPNAGLNVYGSTTISSSATMNTLYVLSTASNSNAVAGNAVQVIGGMGIGTTLVVGGEHILRGPFTVGPSPITTAQNTITSIILPTTDITYDLGDPIVRWRNVYGKVFQAGPLDTAHFIGIASSSTYLATPSVFTISGDISASPINFSGGGQSVTFNVTATGSLITGKTPVAVTTGSDILLMYCSTSSQLHQQTKRNFLKEINYQDPQAISANTATSTPSGSLVPIGTIMAYGGTDVPYGWLVCDGSTLNTNPIYDNLKTKIGTTYDPVHTNYVLPNLTNLLLSGAVPINYIIKY